jgi:hypothetical protein
MRKVEHSTSSLENLVPLKTSFRSLILKIQKLVNGIPLRILYQFAQIGAREFGFDLLNLKSIKIDCSKLELIT